MSVVQLPNKYTCEILLDLFVLISQQMQLPKTVLKIVQNFYLNTVVYQK